MPSGLFCFHIHLNSIICTCDRWGVAVLLARPCLPFAKHYQSDAWISTWWKHAGTYSWQVMFQQFVRIGFGRHAHSLSCLPRAPLPGASSADRSIIHTDNSRCIIAQGLCLSTAEYTVPVLLRIHASVQGQSRKIRWQNTLLIPSHGNGEVTSAVKHRDKNK